MKKTKIIKIYRKEDSRRQESQKWRKSNIEIHIFVTTNVPALLMISYLKGFKEKVSFEH